MLLMKCVCGEPLSGADEGALFAAIRAHADAKHADLQFRDEQIREVVHARSRMSGWDGEQATLAEPVEICAVTPELREDWLRFFDRDAFMDNPMWAGCFCMFYRFGGTNEEWEKRPGSQNRGDQSAAIARGEVSGLMAYAGGKPVAWCHAAPRTHLPGLDRSDEFAAEDPQRVGAIVCFVVAAPYRGQGVASQLLEGACEHLRGLGMSLVEAYPSKNALSDARAYHGPLPMYLNNGFSVHRETEHFVVVRREL